MFNNVIIIIKKSINYFIKSRQEKRHSLVGAGNLWKMKQQFQIDFLIKQGLNKSDILLDIGCGTLRGGLPMISFLDVSNYYGLEVRKHVLEEGKKELKKQKLDYKMPNLISFIRFDEIKLDVKYDMIFAFSVLIHFNDQIANQCFNFVSKYLKSDGVFFANVNIGDHPDGYWEGFPVVFRKISFYETLANKNGIELEQLGSLKSLGHNSGIPGSDQQIMLKMIKI
ncbi:class I SAM-dependent methyltransferase [Ichthyenterobacterium sp. W332]|uniref:Class I SAM-dependent methyltransferase n=1 Tax=Microcosmobacter mediterraneus TaxID=3075607 RepID=A0ABU2YGQ1_9FLAO|nr:class I SAM-dependent methyltransferase [Ichthyenterobacterium sp. W332]MDT0557360.1 class I SAM-dependent methyltransferase [Ichthyenterobacterium sp. W332]